MTDDPKQFWDSVEQTGINPHSMMLVMRIDDYFHRALHIAKHAECTTDKIFVAGGSAEQALRTYEGLRDKESIKDLNTMLGLSRKHGPDKYPRKASMGEMLEQCRKWKSARITETIDRRNRKG
jgi:hypothetical protein